MLFKNAILPIKSSTLWNAVIFCHLIGGVDSSLPNSARPDARPDLIFRFILINSVSLSLPFPSEGSLNSWS